MSCSQREPLNPGRQEQENDPVRSFRRDVCVCVCVGGREGGREGGRG